jgi:type III secretory pathway component EscT
LAIAALSDAIVKRPLGAPSAFGDLGAVALGSAQLLGDAFAAALLIALPVAAALALSDLGVALAARGAAFAALPGSLAPTRAALALLVVAISLVLLLESMPEAFAQGLRAARRLWGLP